jgi:hypothetical protein
LGQEHLHLIATEMVKSFEFQEVLNAKQIKEGKSDIPRIDGKASRFMAHWVPPLVYANALRKSFLPL